ncbi:MAG: ATP-binding protein [bacterium]
MKQINSKPLTGDEHSDSTPVDRADIDGAVDHESEMKARDVFADLEATLDEVARTHPRLDDQTQDPSRTAHDLKALLEVSLAVNSSLVLDDMLQIVMHKAVELMQAERGLIMLLDEKDEFQIRSAYNLRRDETPEEDLKISRTVASEVAYSGKSIYTSDALEDERYAQQQSVVEMHLRSIMCVPLKVKDSVIGVIYLDNSNQARMFLKSDLYLFELYAQMASRALHNASMYDSLLSLKRYNEMVVSKSPVGIIVVDSSGRLATVNSVALEIFDLNREDIRLVGETEEPCCFFDLLPNGEQARWKAMADIALTTQQEVSEPRYFHNTGYIEKALSVKISPLPDLLNGHDGLIMTVEDITEKVLMEKYVILSEKLVAKGEMAASVAHELNNYLAIASNNAELLALNVERQKYDKAVFNSRSITENIFKIKRFVDNLMDFSRPESEYISYDIKHLIEDLLFSLRVQPRFKRMHFNIDMNSEIPNLEIDVGLIQQVLMNLLNNAGDAIDEKVARQGDSDEPVTKDISIAVAYDKENEEISVSIDDSGIGMSPETLSRIFAMHFTTKKGGHGLGLANCKKIVEQHYGELTAQSTLGEGTTFTITLPRFRPKKKKPLKKRQ